MTTAEHATIFRTLEALVGPLNGALVGPTEVAVHDLTKLPDSIVAIAGNVTGRHVGSPATDRLLAEARTGDFRTLVGYESTGPDGRELRSTTIIVRDSAGDPVAAVCLNADVSVWQPLRDVVAALMPGAEWPGRPEAQQSPGDEDFVRDVDELADTLLAQAVAAAGVPVELMQKRHKMQVVRNLQTRGFFLLRESAERAAKALEVSRFTVYNYLNELAEQ